MNQSRNWAVEFDLIIVLALWKDGHLVQVFGEPGRRLGDGDKTVLNRRGLGVQAHDLVGGRLISGHGMAALLDQLLDQLGAGGLVLDQHDVGPEQALLLARRAFERRVFQPPAEQVEQEEIFAFHPPGRAHREIAELGRLVRGIPALHDAVEALRPVLLIVAPEPAFLDQTTAERRRGLLVLAGEASAGERTGQP